MDYTDKPYWDSYWGKENREGNIEFYFSDLLDKYISWQDVNSYMEIGGAPGSILAYMNLEHNLRTATVDFVNKAILTDYLNKFDVRDFDIFNEDFELFDVTEFRHKYNIVASWGFLEHFEKRKVVKFIAKKKIMVSKNGYLIIEMPNIRKLFWLLFWLFNRELIRIHNLKIMNLEWLKNQVLKGDRFEILYASYYFTMNEKNAYFVSHPKMHVFCKHLVRFFQNANLNNGVKKWFYPYIVIIAKRK